MGPELFNPKKFGLKDSRPTKSSDCYALGMVAYEVLSEKVPFYRYGHYAVVLKVSEGKRPNRPQREEGLWFGEDIWNLLQHCWKPRPDYRPGIEDVSRRLEVLGSRTPSQTSTDPWRLTSPPSTLELSTEEGTDEREESSPSRLVLPRLSRVLWLEDNSNKNTAHPSAYHSSALSSEDPDQRAIGTTVANVSGSAEPEQMVDRVRRLCFFGSTWH